MCFPQRAQVRSFREGGPRMDEAREGSRVMRRRMSNDLSERASSSCRSGRASSAASNCSSATHDSQAPKETMTSRKRRGRVRRWNALESERQVR